MCIWLKSPNRAWNSLWHLEQTRFVGTLLIELSLTLDLQSCFYSRPPCLRCNSTIHNDAQPDVFFLIYGFPVIHINVEHFHFSDFSSPKGPGNFLRIRLSSFWSHDQSILAGISSEKCEGIIMSARRILSCHLILGSFFRQFR